MERLIERLCQYALLMRWDKPIGALLLLWPTLWALWLAGRGQPDRGVVTIFVLGVWLMRSAGCVINDIADRNFDPFVARTRDRPLAARRVTVAEALALCCALCLIALALVWQLNALSIQLAVPALALAASYPFMKRFHSLPQLHLGVAFGWGIPMAYAALTGTLPAAAWWLFAANIVWALVYDTQYAMVDRDDDRRVGVKSSAILFGDWDKRIIGILQALLLALLVAVGLLNGLGWRYYLAVAMGAWLLLYQQFLIHERAPAACFRAFLNNNGFGLVIFCGIVLDLLPSGKVQ